MTKQALFEHGSVSAFCLWIRTVDETKASLRHLFSRSNVGPDYISVLSFMSSPVTMFELTGNQSASLLCFSSNMSEEKGFSVRTVKKYLVFNVSTFFLEDPYLCSSSTSCQVIFCVDKKMIKELMQPQFERVVACNVCNLGSVFVGTFYSSRHGRPCRIRKVAPVTTGFRFQPMAAVRPASKCPWARKRNL